MPDLSLSTLLEAWTNSKPTDSPDAYAEVSEAVVIPAGSGIYEHHLKNFPRPKPTSGSDFSVEVGGSPYTEVDADPTSAAQFRVVYDFAIIRFAKAVSQRTADVSYIPFGPNVTASRLNASQDTIRRFLSGFGARCEFSCGEFDVASELIETAGTLKFLVPEVMALGAASAEVTMAAQNHAVPVTVGTIVAAVVQSDFTAVLANYAAASYHTATANKIVIPLFFRVAAAGNVNDFYWIGPLTVSNAAWAVLSQTSTASMRAALGLGTMATETAANYLTAAGNLFGLADAATARGNLGVAIGSQVQAYNANLASLAGLTLATDAMIYASTSGVLGTTTITALGRTLVGRSTAQQMRDTLGLDTDDAVQFGEVASRRPVITVSSADRTLTPAESGSVVLCSAMSSNKVSLPTTPTAGLNYLVLMDEYTASSEVYAAAGFLDFTGAAPELDYADTAWGTGARCLLEVVADGNYWLITRVLTFSTAP